MGIDFLQKCIDAIRWGLVTSYTNTLMQVISYSFIPVQARPGTQIRDQRESRKNLDLDNFSLISSNLGLGNHENCSLGRVSISTILKSESRPDLDLDNLGNTSLVPISISTIF